MFKKIIDGLEKIKQEVEGMDDPAGDADQREDVGIVHYLIQKCITDIEEI